MLKAALIIASQRGAIFFRNQDIDNEQLKVLGNKLGQLTGRPEESKLHRHALSSKDNVKNHDENGQTDEEVFFVSSEVSNISSYKSWRIICLYDSIIRERKRTTAIDSRRLFQSSPVTFGTLSKLPCLRKVHEDYH